ncbi:PhnD/SsuA/transferrin family substrate-binding protein [Oceanisphaera sp. KMM 10153]|uniref:PhnD/SsuA/transferrin family substrate-binding protein n=1 Tax=Oceanisphaera submarina TaxID=3390193 RepID=UPI00397632A5
MSLVASLPWYDLPPLQPGLDTFWSVLRNELHRLSAPLSSYRLPIPDTLDRHTPLVEQWTNPGLLLSQCCGPDLFTPQARGLVPIARPVFSDLDCTPGQYFSYIVSASGREPASPQSAGTVRFVINSASSRSGCAALFEWASANGIDGDQVLLSGGHAASLEYLRNGAADLAAIDAHSWPLLDSRGITIIGRSTEAPAPPFVMHQRSPIHAALMYEALSDTIQQAGASINIEAVMSTCSQTYHPIQIPVAWHARLPVGASPCCVLV